MCIQAKERFTIYKLPRLNRDDSNFVHQQEINKSLVYVYGLINL